MKITICGSIAFYTEMESARDELKKFEHEVMIPELADEGGLLSHASIVSRELGKPCIVGCKIATKVLKGGDGVEVDADRGTVRILK